MSLGTWIITAFTVVALATSVLWFFRGNGLVRKLFEAVGIILGGSTAAYTGVLLSFARGRPFWVSPFLPWLFVVSGLLTGLAIALFLVPIIAVFMPRFFEDFKELFDERIEYIKMISVTERYITVLAIIEIALIVLFVFTAPGGSSLLSMSGISTMFFIYLILGLIIPLGIGYYNTKVESKGNQNSVMLFSMAGYIFTLIGGFLLRHVILTAGQLIA
jgi:formate-dependent nitrite reductase membrane component NrfD